MTDIKRTYELPDEVFDIVKSFMLPKYRTTQICRVMTEFLEGFDDTYFFYYEFQDIFRKKNRRVIRTEARKRQLTRLFIMTNNGKN